jgi:hypothetical protein
VSNPDFDIRIYNDKKFKDEFINEIPQRYDQLSCAHQSDYVRVCLVEKYGGFWIDASVILMGSLSPYYNKDTVTELTGFYPSWSNTYFENWFFTALPNNDIVTKWKAEYVKAIDMGFDEYKEFFIEKINTLDADEDYKKDLMTCCIQLPYLTQFACYRAVCIDSNIKGAKSISAIEGPYNFLIPPHFGPFDPVDRLFEKEYICENFKYLNAPIIKLCRWERNTVMSRMDNGNIIEKESVLDKYILPYYRKCVILKITAQDLTEDLVRQIIDLYHQYHDRYVIISLKLSMNSYQITDDTDCNKHDLESFNDIESLFASVPEFVNSNKKCFVEYSGKYYYKNLIGDEYKHYSENIKDRKLYVLKDNISKLLDMFNLEYETAFGDKIRSLTVFTYTNETIKKFVKNNNDKHDSDKHNSDKHDSDKHDSDKHDSDKHDSDKYNDNTVDLMTLSKMVKYRFDDLKIIDI